MAEDQSVRAEEAHEKGDRTLDTRGAVEAAVREGGIDRYYADRHMTDDGNRLTAELIAEALSGGMSLLPESVPEWTSKKGR